MKLKIIIGVIVFIISLIAGLCYASYQVGIKETEAKYSEEVAKITEKALREQAELQIKLDEISHEYFESTLSEQARITELQRQLRDQPDTISCTKVAGGDSIAIIPDSSIRLLRESTNYKALHKATSESCPISRTGTVTANLLTEYAVCIIGKYNVTAKQLTGLIGVVNKYKEEQNKKE